jgi:hypothetical protein
VAGRALRAAALLIILVSVLAAGRVGWVGYGPIVASAQVPAQVEFLQSAIDDGAGPRMQQLFPEGEFFLTSLTAAAAARSDLAGARLLRNRLNRPELVANFGSGMTPEHGIFHAGWTLSVAVDLAEASGDAADRTAVERAALPVDAAYRASRTGFLEGYPGQYWPCDSVVGAAALARAAVLLDRADWLATVRAWRDTVNQHLDPTTGLLPHRVDGAGQAQVGPRGSSQAIIQAFWPAIAVALDGAGDEETWTRFTAAFVTRQAGLVGVREFPAGQAGVGDVDSGPLVLGVSTSASVVTLAAARTVGDQDLAAALTREAELLGLPLQWAGQRRYALGLLPVGDAFLAWARSRTPLASAASVESESPGPWWPLLIGLALVPALAVAVGFAAHRHRRRRVTARSDSGSPPR